MVIVTLLLAHLPCLELESRVVGIFRTREVKLDRQNWSAGLLMKPPPDSPRLAMGK